MVHQFSTLIKDQDVVFVASEHLVPYGMGTVIVVHIERHDAFKHTLLVGRRRRSTVDDHHVDVSVVVHVGGVQLLQTVRLADAEGARAGEKSHKSHVTTGSRHRLDAIHGEPRWLLATAQPWQRPRLLTLTSLPSLTAALPLDGGGPAKV